MELFNFVDLGSIKLLEIELFDYWTVWKQMTDVKLNF